MLLTELGRRTPRHDAVRFDGHPPHRHERPQVVYVVLGTATLNAGDDHFTITEGTGVWLPATIEHHLSLESGGVVMGPLLPTSAQPPGGQACLVDSPALRRLMTTLLSVAPRTEVDIRLFRSELERTLRDVTATRFTVPMPHHPAAREIAQQAVPSSDSLQRLAARHYISARHAQRLFMEETGLPFGRWRTRARLNAALAVLGNQQDMAAALAASGFTTRQGLRRALAREGVTSVDAPMV
ncbi:AraC family transcriptional regulator [Phytoactinopolyspora limicola]|uniref:AraC family transcriptional regulator n=1 Tax=Phytoactinopolyspora limicola TaxID=2715536 RepID=UPI00140766D4|nr:helix-turn-helix transcriptional regulator [Phytoactinopolyspora limicola]